MSMEKVKKYAADVKIKSLCGLYLEEGENLIERVNDKTNNRFNDKAIWDSISAVERAKVTNKLRLAIYERDDYCCVK